MNSWRLQPNYWSHNLAWNLESSLNYCPPLGREQYKHPYHQYFSSSSSSFEFYNDSGMAGLNKSCDLFSNYILNIQDMQVELCNRQIFSLPRTFCTVFSAHCSLGKFIHNLLPHLYFLILCYLAHNSQFVSFPMCSFYQYFFALKTTFYSFLIQLYLSFYFKAFYLYFLANVKKTHQKCCHQGST